MNKNQHHAPRESIDLTNEKIALCRCWQSKKFPLCDGSHRQYNDEHQDHLGPIIVCCQSNWTSEQTEKK